MVLEKDLVLQIHQAKVLQETVQYFQLSPQQVVAEEEVEVIQVVYQITMVQMVVLAAVVQVLIFPVLHTQQGCLAVQVILHQ